VAGPTGAEGPRISRPGALRLARVLALAACLFFALVAFWEIAGPLPGGHLGNAAGAAIGGENMGIWRIFLAVPDYRFRRPLPADGYMHHPYGVFVLEALAHAITGHRWATVRLPAAVMSSLTTPLVYLLSRALWGPWPAALAALAFAVLPMDLAFASFHNLEGTVLFFGMLFSWATVRLWQTWRPRYLLPAVIGALGACQGDWVGLVLVGTTGLFAFLRAYVLPGRWYGGINHRQHARWFAWITAAAVASLLLYLVLFARAGKLGELLAAGDQRSAGADATWAAIFGPRRRMWVLFLFPWPALGLLAFSLPASLVALGRRAEGALPFAWIAAATFQYFVFRQGADVHVFWPHYYGAVVALGAAQLTAAGLWLNDRCRARWPSARAESLRLAALFGPLALLLLATLRVGLTQVYQSHLTGGRFDDGGRYIAVDQDRSSLAEYLRPLVPPGSSVGLHRSFFRTWNVEYGLRSPVQALAALPGARPPDDTTRLVLLDARYCTADELKAAARDHALRLAGPFAWYDRDAAPSLPIALRYEERQPRGLERYFLTGTDLRREVGPGLDDWATAEWREHLGLEATPPATPPATPAAARVASNLATARGDAAGAAALRRQVEEAYPGRFLVDFSGGVRLVGLRVEEGPAVVVSLLWETAPTFQPFDGDFLVRSWVTAPPRLWASATDYFEKEVAPPTALRPALWRPGHLYEQRFVAMRRAGVESFEGLWVSRQGARPVPALGGERVPLFTLR
jgi:hypothetical protein